MARGATVDVKVYSILVADCARAILSSASTRDVCEDALCCCVCFGLFCQNKHTNLSGFSKSRELKAVLKPS